VVGVFWSSDKVRRLLVALCLGTAFLTSAGAQTYPDRPVRIVVPFAAGGGSDVSGRAIALKLTEMLGQSFVVENRTGAAGSIGATQVARATPDGYTLLLGSSSEIAQYPNVAPNVPYDPVHDFVPVALIATVPMVLVVTDSLPVKSTQELIAYARANPGKLNFGSGGAGSTSHLAMALFNSMTNTQMTHVPYRGSTPVVSELIAGNLHLAMSSMSSAMPHAHGGKIRLLAVSTPKRSAMMPDLPTLDESGVPGYATGMWTGLMAPAGTPPAIVDRLAKVVAEALATSDMKGILAGQGAEQSGGTPAQFADEIRRELALWKDLAQKTGIRID
jgi:tripartite-type tricarboxylate transporter receptor subunit TctC